MLPLSLRFARPHSIEAMRDARLLVIGDGCWISSSSATCIASRRSAGSIVAFATGDATAPGRGNTHFALARWVRRWIVGLVGADDAAWRLQDQLVAADVGAAGLMPTANAGRHQVGS
jgi:hypothetical protein